MKAKTYKKLRRKCLKQRKLFEDAEFPATAASISKHGLIKNADRISWRRPGQIHANPRLVVDGLNAHDVTQGQLGNCWFVSALAVVSNCKDLWRRLIPDVRGQEWPTSATSSSSTVSSRYCGIFRFRFWQFGRWIQVVIDDRLPTDAAGRLVFARSQTENEFWSALLEKAYAKMNGSYDVLIGGQVEEGLVDLSGGFPQRFSLPFGDQLLQFDMKPERKELFSTLKNALVSRTGRALICASIYPPPMGSAQQQRLRQQRPGKVEGRLENGLYTTHAYSVTDLKRIQARRTSKNNKQQEEENSVSRFLQLFKREKLKMIRVRNPWGAKEWTGAFSDESEDWKRVSAAEKKRIGLSVENDGEFWMPWEDFLINFDSITVVQLPRGRSRAFCCRAARPPLYLQEALGSVPACQALNYEGSSSTQILRAVSVNAVAEAEAAVTATASASCCCIIPSGCCRTRCCCSDQHNRQLFSNQFVVELDPEVPVSGANSATPAKLLIQLLQMAPSNAVDTFDSDNDRRHHQQQAEGGTGGEASSWGVRVLRKNLFSFGVLIGRVERNRHSALVDATSWCRPLLNHRAIHSRSLCLSLPLHTYDTNTTDAHGNAAISPASLGPRNFIIQPYVYDNTVPISASPADHAPPRQMNFLLRVATQSYPEPQLGRFLLMPPLPPASPSQSPPPRKLTLVTRLQLLSLEGISLASLGRSPPDDAAAAASQLEGLGGVFCTLSYPACPPVCAEKQKFTSYTGKLLPASRLAISSSSNNKSDNSVVSGDWSQLYQCFLFYRKINAAATKAATTTANNSNSKLNSTQSRGAAAQPIRVRAYFMPGSLNSTLCSPQSRSRRLLATFDVEFDAASQPFTSAVSASSPNLAVNSPNSFASPSKRHFTPLEKSPVSAFDVTPVSGASQKPRSMRIVRLKSVESRKLTAANQRAEKAGCPPTTTSTQIELRIAIWNTDDHSLL